MNKETRYLSTANKCQRMALQAKTEEERTSWLRLAEGCLQLLSWKSRREDALNVHLNPL
jgi:hypothetical protein